MKTQAITKVIAFASIIAGINMLSSCDSCNRKDESYDSNVDTTTTVTETDTTIAGDTTAYDQAEGSGTMTTTSSSKRSASTAGAGAGRGETASATSSGESSPAIDRENDPIENTSVPARKKGEPVDSGGTAGSGSGTGTGSTGNNSRVSKKTDQ